MQGSFTQIHLFSLGDVAEAHIELEDEFEC